MILFDVIRDIIDHLWVTSDPEQQYIYYICAVCIPLCIILAVDLIHCIFRSFTRFK